MNFALCIVSRFTATREVNHLGLVIMDPFQDGWNMKLAVASVLRMAE